MPHQSLNVAETVAMLQAAADCVIQSEPLLSEADRNIGDGDHGLGMKRGMLAAKSKLDAGEFASVEEPLMAVGMAMMSSMGGASGAIFGTLFRSGGKSLDGRESLDSQGLSDFLCAALEGVQARGKAAPGDKTVVDALAAAADKSTETVNQPLSEAFPPVAAAAEAGTEGTKQMVAKFGRAKALGEKSLGHPDAGALSTSVILRAMSDYVAALN